MDSLPTGSPNINEDLIKIETDLFNLYIEGKPYHPTFEKINSKIDLSNKQNFADFDIWCDNTRLNINKIEVFNPQINKLDDWDNTQQALPIFFETQTYNLLIEKKNAANISFFHINHHIHNAVKQKNNRIISGNINFGNEIGFTELVIQLNDLPILKLNIEVFPVKLNYKKDYLQILDDINAELYNLTFDFLRKTHQQAKLTDTKNQSLTEYYSILTTIFKKLIHSINLIALKPNKKMDSLHHVVNTNQSKRYSNKSVNYLVKNQSKLVHNETYGMITIGSKKYLPTHVLNKRNESHFDIHENQFIRFVLVQVTIKLKRLLKLIKKSNMNKNDRLINQIHSMLTTVDRTLKLDFLQVKKLNNFSLNLVLQMAPHYKDVYKYYLLLQKGLSIEQELHSMSLKDLAELYEYWCFIKINSILSKKYKLLKQDHIKINYQGIFNKLLKSNASTMLYLNPRNGETFSLSYNKEISGPTLTQKPDNVLSLTKKESAVEYKFIFDAKYKLNPAIEETKYARDYNGIMGPEEEDINTMHRYRDSIVQEHKSSDNFERTMFGAFVLFPHHDEQEYQKHKLYKSISSVNIGAFPLLPGSTSLFEQFIDSIINDSPEATYERGISLSGNDQYLEYAQRTKNVLVGCLSQQKQFEVAINHNFYHTPLRNIIDHSDVKQIEYVALYQSKRFFEKSNLDAGIHHYAKVKSMRIVKRKEITEIASVHGSPDELYVIFYVDKWELRSKPIVPAGYGVQAVVFTSKYIFDRAQEIAELKLDSNQQLLEWRESRRVGKVSVELDSTIIDEASITAINISPEIN